MKLITKTSAAVLVAMLGLGALAPAAFAQDQAPQAGPAFGPRHQMAFRAHDGNGQRMIEGHVGARGGVLPFGCSENGAERLEHVFVSLSHNLDLTAEQQPLFDALKTDALTAQTGLADTCAAAHPADAAKAPSIVERMQTRIKIDEAQTAALSSVLPELQAFYDSLTAEQKATLDAGPGRRNEHFGKRQGGPGMGFGQHRPMMDQNG